MISDEITRKIEKLVEGLPDWLRQDLISKDAVVRSRAEETLSAMIGAAFKAAKPA